MKSRVFLFFSTILIFSSVTLFSDNTKTYPDDIAMDLKAVLIEEFRVVQLDWTPPTKDGDIIIARSTSIIDTPEKLYYADSLGRFPNTASSKLSTFQDRNLKPGSYYYAITTVTRVKKKDVLLVPNINYTTVAIQVGAKKEEIAKEEPKEKELVDSSKSVQNISITPFESYVRVSWDPPENADKTNPVYHIYRSLTPLDNRTNLNESDKLIEIYHPETNYIDKHVDSGVHYYYGVSVDIKGEEFLPLVEERSFTKLRKKEKRKTEIAEEKKEVKPVEEKKEEIAKPVEPPKKEEPVKPAEVVVEPKKEEIPSFATILPKKDSGFTVSDLNYEFRKDGITLTWDPPQGAIENATTYTIYYSTSNPKNLAKSIENGKAQKLGEVVHPETIFQIPKAERKKVIYFAVTARQLNMKENTTLEENESFVKIYPESSKPEEKPKSEKKTAKKDSKKKTSPTKEEPKEPVEDIAVDENQFSTVMRDYFLQGKFKTAYEKFSKIYQQETDKSIKTKALFYMAVSLYRNGDSDSALKILVKEELKQNYDRDRVDFYINRCLEKRGITE
ncbi:MAG: hypothetical protein SFU98_20255 [Leptospiraceae bacterium]|nr:hypothetical protein [Leptospiraceae bacterium]